MKRIIPVIFVLLSLAAALPLIAAEFSIEKAEPPNWWTGFKETRLQLMVYGQDLHGLRVESGHPDLRVEKITETASGNYLFLDLQIGPGLAPGEHALVFTKNNFRHTLSYPVYERAMDPGTQRGLEKSDIIYLVTPDRFANGNPANDEIEGYRDHVNREGLISRHGGDIEGILSKLDYIQDLGFTALWINPMLENNMDISYHGYAATDLYRIDPRFGSNQLYRQLAEEARKRGMKFILDHVSNHVGMYHRWAQEPPFPDWFHGTPDSFTHAAHYKEILQDPYADSLMRRSVTDGWFVREMPDLNQDNPFLAAYMVQNTIWWIEFAGIDAIREDTYPYCDADFMSRWAQAIQREFPNFTILGEVWEYDPVYLSRYQKDSFFPGQVNTHLPSLTDFGLSGAFGDVLMQGNNIFQLYKILTRDILYIDPGMLVTFLDNHDIMRLYDLVHGDLERYRFALELLFTLRGIPQIYYGTELALPGGDDHGLIRRDFPGGFPGDERNAFTAAGRSTEQNIIFDHLKQLIAIRKNNSALFEGNMTHFPPQGNVYVYFRRTDKNGLLIIANNNNQEKSIALNSYRHHLKNILDLVDLQSGEVIKNREGTQVPVSGSDVRIFRLEK